MPAEKSLEDVIESQRALIAKQDELIAALKSQIELKEKMNKLYEEMIQKQKERIGILEFLSGEVK